MKNFFIKKWSDLFIYLSKTVREWFENGSRMVRQMCAAWAMLRGKCVNCAKSLMQIFATFATYASAIFVGKESNENTVRYALWSRISLTKPLPNPYLTLTRFRLSLGSNLSRFSLVSLICLCMLTVASGNVWGKDVTFTAGTDDTSGGKDGVTIVISSGDDSGNPYKIYKDATATFTVPTGYNITKIVFTSTNKGTEKYSLKGFGTGAPATWSYDPSANVYTGTWTGSTSSVIFTASSAQVRLTSIVVTITASTTYSVTWKSDGVTVHTDAAVPSGTTVSTPSDPAVPSGCTGAKFMGWTATENYSHATDAPGDLFNGTSPTINSAKTYYAVFADEE